MPQEKRKHPVPAVTHNEEGAGRPDRQAPGPPDQRPPVLLQPGGQPGPGPGMSRQLQPNLTPAAPENLPASQRGTGPPPAFSDHQAPPCPRARVNKPAGTGEGAAMEKNGANGGHQHEVFEKRPSPDIFTTRLDIELCACGARRWVDRDGAPATPWQFMNLRRPGGGKG